MIDYLTAAYESGDRDVQLLYKYRSCDPHHIQCLRDDTLWFSTAAQLNDPFDCRIRLPEALGPDHLKEIRTKLHDAQPFRASLKSPEAVAEYIAEARELPPLIPLGLMAIQLGPEKLVKHIKEIHAKSDNWITELFLMARDVSSALLHNTTVFCLCERRDHHLMWAHYAASHTGFCTGYVSPVGIDNPRLIHKMAYLNSPPRITPWQLIDDPGQVHADLTLTKPSDWAYEREWRVTFGNVPGLLDNLLPYKEVVLGAKISEENENKIREAIHGRDVALYRARIDPNADSYKIGIQRA